MDTTPVKAARTPTRRAKPFEIGRAARESKDVVTLGAWMGSARRLKELARASSMSMGFLLGAMQLHFSRISDQERAAAVLKPVRIEGDRFTTVWACNEVADLIRAEADRYDMPVSRVVNALVEAWEILPGVGRTEAMKMELGRVEERRRVRVSEAANGGAA